MNITDPLPDDLTVQEAAAMARRNPKTIRRAIQAGELPRRYVMSERGPQLVFRSDELRQWLESRAVRAMPDRRLRSSAAPDANTDWTALVDAVARLQAGMEASQAQHSQLTSRLSEQDQAMLRARETIAALAERLHRLEHGSRDRQGDAAALTARSREQP